METQNSESAETPLSIAEYAAELAKSGIQNLPGSQETIWARYETAAMMRLPTFCSSPPTSDEIWQVLTRGRAAVVSYVLAPNGNHLANSWLYVCQDQSYSLDKLSKNARRDVRRAQRELLFRSIDWDTLLRFGLQAFSDTRARVGISDGTPEQFRYRFERFARNPAHYAFGAWHTDRLVAFMTLVVVGDWVEIEGSFSANTDQGSCPNNGLSHYVLDHFLAQKRCRTVSYGLSSIQQNSGEAGLHYFKQKVGFEARPVHRVFVVHPLLRPFANKLTLWGINGVLQLRPGSRLLRKAGGMLFSMLERGQTGRITYEDKRNG